LDDAQEMEKPSLGLVSRTLKHPKNNSPQSKDAQNPPSLIFFTNERTRFDALSLWKIK